jgi:predicted nucleotidyltransferase
MWGKAMVEIRKFSREFVDLLPETHELLLKSNMVIHDAVVKIILHGSRGLKGGARIDSDIDLSLVVDGSLYTSARDKHALMYAVIETTRIAWTGEIICDLAALYDRSGCGLSCLNHNQYEPALCECTLDCIGLFKMQKEFSGFVSGPIVDCSKMYPLISVWEKE